MKSDRKLLTAVIILIGLVVWLLVIMINKSQETAQNTREIKSVQESINQIKASSSKVVQPLNGKTPVLGVDYFNGRDSVSHHTTEKVTFVREKPTKGERGESAYQIAVRSGFKGSEKDWLESLKPQKGERGDSIDIDCIGGVIVKKYTSDDFWNMTKIKCEVAHE